MSQNNQIAAVQPTQQGIVLSDTPTYIPASAEDGYNPKRFGTLYLPGKASSPGWFGQEFGEVRSTTIDTSIANKYSVHVLKADGLNGSSCYMRVAVGIRQQLLPKACHCKFLPESFNVLSEFLVYGTEFSFCGYNGYLKGEKLKFLPVQIDEQYIMLNIYHPNLENIKKVYNQKEKVQEALSPLYSLSDATRVDLMRDINALFQIDQVAKFSVHLPQAVAEIRARIDAKIGKLRSALDFCVKQELNREVILFSNTLTLKEWQHKLQA